MSGLYERNSQALDGLLDVAITNLQNNDLIKYNSVSDVWENSASSGDTLAELLANGNTSGANNLIIDNGQVLTTNTINETTAASGVTIDSVLLKDDGVNATNIEITNLKANDGTSAGSIANSTGVVTLASSVLTTTDINAGTIDGTVIGGATAAAGTFTTGQFNTSVNVDGNITAAERLGIGIAPPTSVIDARQFVIAGSTQIRLRNTDTNNTTTQSAALALAPDGRGRGALISAVKENADFTFNTERDVALVFSPVLNNTATEHMRITSAGNVGIGTTTPAAALQIAKGITATAPPAGSNNACACFGNDTSDDNYGVCIGADGFGKGYITAQRTDGTAVVYDLCIQPNGGNVGIGTTTPSAKLDVNGIVNISRQVGSSGNLLLQGDNHTTGIPRLIFNTELTPGGAVVASDMGLNSSNSFVFSTDIEVNGTAQVGSLTLAVGGGLNGLGPLSISTTATDITGGNDFGSLVIVAGNDGGNIFSDLVYYATTMGATVLVGGSVSGSPAARTYTVVSSKLQLAMASDTYSVSATTTQGTI